MGAASVLPLWQCSKFSAQPGRGTQCCRCSLGKQPASLWSTHFASRDKSEKEVKLASVLTYRTEMPLTTCPSSTFNKQQQGGRCCEGFTLLLAALAVPITTSSHPSSHWQPGLAATITLVLRAYIYFHPIRKNMV